MIKLIIFGVLGLALGIGGGSAMSVMKAKKTYATWEAKKAKAVADSIAEAESHPVAKGAGTDEAMESDSTARGAEHATDSAKAEAAHDTAASHGPPTKKPAPAPRPVQVATVESHGTAKPSGKPTVPLPPSPLPMPAAQSQITQKMGKIFGAMPPKDAAKVMEQLDDAEVRSILSGLTDKQAAGVLQNLPAARAAAISKLLLRGAH